MYLVGLEPPQTKYRGRVSMAIICFGWKHPKMSIFIGFLCFECLIHKNPFLWVSNNSIYFFTWQIGGIDFLEQQGVWSRPSARQENIWVSQGAQIIRSVTEAEPTRSGSQKSSTHLENVKFKFIKSLCEKFNKRSWLLNQNKWKEQKGLMKFFIKFRK